MATNSRVSPRRFSTVPSTPAKAPCRTLTRRPGARRLSIGQRGVGGDQLAKLPQVENKLLGLLDRRERGKSGWSSGIAPAPPPPHRERDNHQKVAPARFSCGCAKRWFS